MKGERHLIRSNPRWQCENVPRYRRNFQRRLGMWNSTRDFLNLETLWGVSSRVQAGIYLRTDQSRPGLPPSLTSQGFFGCGFVLRVVSNPVHFTV